MNLTYNYYRHKQTAKDPRATTTTNAIKCINIFLRESLALSDYFHPILMIRLYIGEATSRGAKLSLSTSITSPIRSTDK